MQIETRLLERSGNAVSNFDSHLPKPQSDLARESLKDPYRFDFLGLTLDAQELEIENVLVKHVTEFLLARSIGLSFNDATSNVILMTLEKWSGIRPKR